MTEWSANDFLSQYKLISNKLKKRFLRKPNVAESSDQFGALGVQCENEDLPQYAGLCYLAQSKCEAALNNSSGEAWCLVKAGRQFLQTYQQSEKMGLVSSGDEFLEGAISCLGHAGLLWPNDPEKLHAASIALQTGQAVENCRPHQAASSYLKANQLLANYPSLQLHPLKQLASCHIRMGDLDGALSVLSQTVNVVETITNQPFGIYSDILLSCEVSRVLLLLLLRPPPQMLPAHLSAVLERYSWITDSTDSPVAWMSEELFTVLQSLVMSCQAKDTDSLLAVEDQLWPHLDFDQQQLFTCLVQSITLLDDS